MADDDGIKNQLKLSQQLVMTPQLQMAIKILATPSRELPVAQWIADTPGLVHLPVDERDPLDVEEEANAADPEQDLPPWFPATESPLPVLAEIPDVWVFGNPPQARANRAGYPRLKGETTEAKWLLRALRQRARTYEKIVQAIVDLRPLLGVTLDPQLVDPVPVRAVADAVGMHESTITRVAQGCRLQNLHLIVAIAKQGKKLGFKAG